MIQDWYLITQGSLQDLGQSVLFFIPNLLGAFLVFILGWFIASAIGKLIVKTLERLKFNKLFERGGWKETLEKADVKVNVSEFIGAIVKWIFVIIFLLAAVEILGLTQFAGFLESVINWLPNLLVAAVIFVVAVIIADIIEKIVRAWVEQMRIGYASAIGTFVRWSIWLFAILAILLQLGIAPALIQTLFNGFIAMLVISGGLAFGLGGKDIAAEILQDVRNKFQK